jgi:hypothetical protein
LVQNSGTSVRELEGALNRVSAMAAVRGTAITAELAEAALGPYARPRNTVSVEVIQELVSTKFGLSVEDLVSHRRERDVSYPRQLAMYLSRTLAAGLVPVDCERSSAVGPFDRDVRGARHREPARAEAAVDQMLLGNGGRVARAMRLHRWRRFAAALASHERVVGGVGGRGAVGRRGGSGREGSAGRGAGLGGWTTWEGLGFMQPKAAASRR